jgi:hypothetical protein
VDRGHLPPGVVAPILVPSSVLRATAMPTYADRCLAFERIRYEARKAEHYGRKTDWTKLLEGAFQVTYGG